MRLVLQRVQTGRVSVDGQTIAEIGPGMVILLGVAPGWRGAGALAGRKNGQFANF